MIRDMTFLNLVLFLEPGPKIIRDRIILRGKLEKIPWNEDMKFLFIFYHLSN